MSKRCITLSDVEMEFLLSMPGGEILLHLWRLLMPGEFDTADTVDPQAYSLPDSQWGALCRADKIPGSLRLNLQWMNIGPSAFPG